MKKVFKILKDNWKSLKIAFRFDKIKVNKFLKDYGESLSIAILSIIALILLKSFIEKFLANIKILNEILFTIYLPTTIVYILKLHKRLSQKSIKKLDSLREIIGSKKLNDSSRYYIDESIDKIFCKFSSLLTSKKTENILWELENLELDQLERECASTSCTLNCGLSIPIKDNIKKHRRIRITAIANSLILSGKESEYLTTETRSPSEIILTDEDYYEKQKNNLIKYKPENACRILILSKDKFKEELSQNDKLEEFIAWNNIEYGNNKLKLKFISYDTGIKQVFNNYSFDSLFDFAISKKENQITVFAQEYKGSYITSFDSQNDLSKKDALDYYECFKALFNHTGSNNGSVKYSNEINSLDNAKEFINNLN